MKKAPSLLPSPVERGDNDAVIGNKQESERASIWRGDAAIAAVSLWETKIKKRRHPSFVFWLSSALLSKVGVRYVGTVGCGLWAHAPGLTCLPVC